MRGILELKSEGLCRARSVQSSLNPTEIKNKKKNRATAVCSKNVILSWGEFTRAGRNGAIWPPLGNVCMWWCRKTCLDLLAAWQSTETYLAASPPGRRFDTLGLPSLSDPPEMVRPRLLPSRFIRSTVVTPRCSSADRWRIHSQRLPSAWQIQPPPRAKKRLTFFFFVSLPRISHKNVPWHLLLQIFRPRVNLCDRFRKEDDEFCFIHPTLNKGRRALS